MSVGPAFAGKLEAALKLRLGGARVLFERTSFKCEGGFRYRVHVASPALSAERRLRRQDVVWDVAKESLTAAELDQISVFVTNRDEKAREALRKLESEKVQEALTPGEAALVCRAARDARQVEGGGGLPYVAKSGVVELFLPAGRSLRGAWAGAPERLDRSDVSPFDRYVVRFEWTSPRTGRRSVSFGTPIASTVARAPVKSA